jgi:hypothetical protein
VVVGKRNFKKGLGVISTPTTFVIGAGASKGLLDLPTATDLRAEALALRPESLTFQLLLNLAGQPTPEWPGIDLASLETVLDDLRDHPAPSIDAYLESRQPDARTMQIGRTLIALLLGLAIVKARTHSTAPAEDWLGYVIERMRRGAATPAEFAAGNAGVKFVTFNFDSVIEDRLSNAVRAIYRYPAGQDLTAALDVCQVTHVHGRIPPPPEVPIGPSVSNLHPEWRAWPTEAAKRVNVVLDTIDVGLLHTARETVRGAHVLCFLGFSYDRGNLERLDVATAVQQARKPEVFGSAFGLTPGEKTWVHARMPGIELGHSGMGCRETLANFYVFRD